MAKTTKKDEEVRGQQADKVVVDEVQDDLTKEETKAVEEGFAEVDTTVPEDITKDEVLDLNERKRQLIEELIGSADERLDSELDQERAETPAPVARDESRKTPATEDNFKRKGASIAGPFSRRRLRPVATDKKPATPVNPRRGVQKIWEDRPIKNV